MPTIETSSGRWIKARAVDATDTAFPAVVPLYAEPTRNGDTATEASYITLAREGGNIQNLVQIVPYASVGSSDDTFDMRVYGWRLFRGPYLGVTRETWLPVFLGQFAVTLGDISTQAASSVGAGAYADTISLTYPATSVPSVEVFSPANDLMAHVTIDVKGFQKLQVTFDAGAQATAVNALLFFY